MDPSQDDQKKVSEFIASRDGILFVIDATPEIFEVDPATGETHFSKCLKVYGSILSKKLSWNRADWMGLILFGTTKWDTDPIETRHILTVQEFDEITSNMFSAIIYIYNNKIEYYKNLASPSEYPLNDVLWKAGRSFDSVKVGMQRRQVVLLTCRDNPFSEDRAEQHRIRLRAKAFCDMNINLRVIGLGDEWNHDLFYKDIEMLANKTDSADFKPMKIDNLELQMKFPARVTGHLPWKIGDGIVVRTVVSSFSRKTQLLKKVVMGTTTNEILDKHTHWQQADMSFGSDDSDSENQEPVKLDEPGSIFKGVNFGNRMIKFLPTEVKKIRVFRKSGIELLGFKPISDDLAHYIKAVKFVGVDPLANTAEKEFFAALLKKCEAKDVMATCVVSHRAGPYLASLIPCIRHSGFYVYKIAYAEQVNDLDEYVSPYVYVRGDEGDRPLPIDNAGVALMKDIIKKLRINWDPYMFQNPKLNSQLKYIETLALDEVAVPIEDTTRESLQSKEKSPEAGMIFTFDETFLSTVTAETHEKKTRLQFLIPTGLGSVPPLDIMIEKLGDLPDRFEQVFAGQDGSVRRNDPGQSQNATQQNACDETAIRQLYESGRLEYSSIVNLKSFARTLGLRSVGRKQELVDRIIEHFRRAM